MKCYLACWGEEAAALSSSSRQAKEITRNNATFRTHFCVTFYPPYRSKEGEQEKPSHFVTIPLRPPAMREARFVRMRGNASPSGQARYFGSHTGSNFSLYCRNPWKL
jgi:hypothetical protein